LGTTQTGATMTDITWHEVKGDEDEHLERADYRIRTKRPYYGRTVFVSYWSGRAFTDGDGYPIRMNTVTHYAKLGEVGR